jgi:hypothetical protein
MTIPRPAAVPPKKPSGASGNPHIRDGRIAAPKSVGHVPTTAVTIATIYSISSSTRASSVGGTVRPSTLAVLRLMRCSNLVGYSTGTSAGLAPFKTLSAISAAGRNTSYAHGRRAENQSHGGCH